MTFFPELLSTAASRDVYHLNLFSACHLISLAMAYAFIQHENAKSSQLLRCFLLLMFQFLVLARLKNFQVLLTTLFVVSCFKRFQSCVYEKFIFIFVEICKTFSFSFGLKPKSLLCMQQKCNKCEELWMIINVFIHVHRAREREKTCFDDFISYGQLTAQLYTVICWQAGKMLCFLWLESFMCKIHFIVVVFFFNCALAVHRLSSIYIFKLLSIIIRCKSLWL